MPNPYLVSLAGQGQQGHWADLEPELREQILRLAEPAPTATVAFADTARLGALEVPVEICFEFTQAHSQRLAEKLLWLRAATGTTRLPQVAPRLRVAVRRRVVANPGELPAEALAAAEALKSLNATVHYHNIAKIRLHEVAFDRYSFEFVGASQLQSYHAPDWALWPFRVYARERAKFTDELSMAFSQTRTASGPLLEYAYDTFH
jgi:hypothetical protein